MNNGTKVTSLYPSAGYGWYVVFVLYLTYTLSFVDRAIILYLVDPIRADLLINDFQFSLIQGLAFTASYSVMGIPLGRLADSRSRRGQLALGITLWVSMTILSGKADIKLVGSSFGGLMATLFTMENNPRVDKMILLAPAINLISFSDSDTVWDEQYQT